MIASPDITCLVTTIQNTSGQALFFGFLPPHGKMLAVDAQVTVFGSITEAVNRGDRFGNRNMKALRDALDNQLLEILSTPAPIFFDVATKKPRQLQVNNNVLHLLSPSFDHSVTLGEPPYHV
jgi:hypothetical protein